MGRRLSKTFFSFYKDKFCPDLTYLLRYDILQQYATYVLRQDILQRYITYLLRYDILQQYVTYPQHYVNSSTATWHIATICDISTAI